MSKKKVHLMFNHTPYSACGWYLGNHRGMKQTFKIEETTCKVCLRNLEDYKKVSKFAEKERLKYDL